MGKGIAVAGIILILTSLNSNAQKRFSIFIGGGGMYYNGDLSNTSLPGLQTNHLSYGGGLNYHFNKILFIGYRYVNGRISGDDTFANSEGRFNRGLAFQSDIQEHSLRLGMHLFHLGSSNQWSVGAFAGGGYTLFTPLAGMVEGPYNTRIISIPAGISLEYEINETFSLYGEGTYHTTFTDYLDDVSQRGNPNRNDGFLDVLIGLKIKFGKNLNIPKNPYAGELDGGEEYACPAYQ